MKRILFSVWSMLVCLVAFGQTVTITHGVTTGTTGITTNPIDRTGISGTTMSGAVRYIWTKADINAAGLTGAANITSIAFDKIGGSTCTGTASSCGTIGQTNVNIYMRSTSANSLNVADGGSAALPATSGFTLVFSGVYDHRGAAGWKTRTFASNFFWDNNSNIEVFITHAGNSLLNSTNRPTWRYGNHTTYPRNDQSRIGRVDGNTLPTLLSLTGNKPHVRFGYT
jgi:hypothetical protein